jgi:hypothetical protein
VLSTEWHEATQSDVLRAVILSGLKLLEKEHAPEVADARKKRNVEKRDAEKPEPPALDKPASPGSKRGKKSKG